MARESVGEAVRWAWKDLWNHVFRKGAVEVQNSVYTGSNVAIPSVVSSAQLENQYDAGLEVVVDTCQSAHARTLLLLQRKANGR